MSISIHVQFADDARAEIGNKISLMGIYSGGIYFGEQPLPVLLPSLTTYMTIEGLDSPATIGVIVSTPSGGILTEIAPQPLSITPNGIATFFVKIAPMTFQEYGNYNFHIKIGDDEFNQLLLVGSTPQNQ